MLWNGHGLGLVGLGLELAHIKLIKSPGLQGLKAQLLNELYAKAGEDLIECFVSKLKRSSIQKPGMKAKFAKPGESSSLADTKQTWSKKNLKSGLDPVTLLRSSFAFAKSSCEVIKLRVAIYQIAHNSNN